MLVKFLILFYSISFFTFAVNSSFTNIKLCITRKGLQKKTIKGSKCMDGKTEWTIFQKLAKDGNKDYVMLIMPGGNLALNSYFYGSTEKRNYPSFGYVNQIANNFKEKMIENYNIIAIPYCSGDLYAGGGKNMTFLDSATLQQRTIEFHGWDGMSRVMDSIKTDLKIESPKEVITVGSSAGAFGLTLNAQHIRSKWTNNTKFIFINDAGVFFEAFPNSCFLEEGKNIFGMEDANTSCGNACTDGLQGSVNKMINSTKDDTQVIFVGSEADGYLANLFSISTISYVPNAAIAQQKATEFAFAYGTAVQTAQAKQQPLDLTAANKVKSEAISAMDNLVEGGLKPDGTCDNALIKSMLSGLPLYLGGTARDRIYAAVNGGLKEKKIPEQIASPEKCLYDFQTKPSDFMTDYNCMSQMSEVPSAATGLYVYSNRSFRTKTCATNDNVHCHFAPADPKDERGHTSLGDPSKARHAPAKAFVQTILQTKSQFCLNNKGLC